MRPLPVGIVIAFAALVAAVAHADTLPVEPRRVVVGNFSAADLTGWNERIFRGTTHYRPAVIDGRAGLAADSHAAASGLHREIRVDLRATPHLEWSWRTENVLHDLDETTKSGDDYPLRIYVIISGGWRFWQTRTLCYVWSSHQPVGAAWPNAFTSNAVMVAVQSGAGQIGQWVANRRDVRADIKHYLGVDVDHIDAIAIMTDTDNSGQSVRAWYGDISFSGD